MSTTIKLTPASGKISGGSHSNMPMVVVPSEITNLGSLTLAEAESCRVYSDASLTTELAREVVSADEIYVKVPSLSTSSEVYFDYDGARADYAVTATYGAESVWDDYDFVSHDGGANDSTANGYASSGSGGISSGDSTGKLGQATTYDGIDDFFTIDASLAYNSETAATWQAWLNPNSATPPTIETIITTQDGASGWGTQLRDTGVVSTFNYALPSGNDSAEGGALSSGNWGLVHFAYDNSNYLKNYVNGINTASDTSVGIGINGGGNVYIGARAYSTPDRFWTGLIDEIRLRKSTLSDDWITTEHNNMGDNGAFWDSEDVSVAGPDAYDSARRGLVMTM